MALSKSIRGGVRSVSLAMAGQDRMSDVFVNVFPNVCMWLQGPLAV